MLEACFSAYPAESELFLHTSGLTVWLDPNAAAFSRVLKVLLGGELLRCLRAAPRKYAAPLARLRAARWGGSRSGARSGRRALWSALAEDHEVVSLFFARAGGVDGGAPRRRRKGLCCLARHWQRQRVPGTLNHCRCPGKHRRKSWRS